MEAQRLAIVGRFRGHPVLPVSPDDFEVRDAGTVDARIVLDRPTISLYCIDHPRQRALFVETPPDVDLTSAPFLYQTQFETAQGLIALPYDTLHALADTVRIDPQRLILIYSTGRCGSTLVSHALNQAEGVVSLSEPDVFTQIQALRAAGHLGDDESGALLRSCTLLLCGARPPHGTASAWALKFRSWGIELGDLFFRHFPEAKPIFLYRNGVAWARSLARMGRLFEPEGAEVGQKMYYAVGPLTPLIAAHMAAQQPPMPTLEVLACMWASVMTRALDLQRQGIPLFAARYEELKVAPREVLAALFSFCGVSPSSSERLERVLGEDSQAGTMLAQAEAQRSSSILSKEQAAELERLIRQHAPSLRADTIVPHTFFPPSSEPHPPERRR